MRPTSLIASVVTVTLAALLSLTAPVAVAGESTVRSYAVEGHGSLELEVPMRWKEEIGWTEGDHRPQVRFRPADGDAFVMTVSVLPPPQDAPADFGTPAWLRAVVDDSARKSLGVGPEKDLALEQIGEGSAVGWYYSVTDQALPDPPPAGAYRVMTQGASAAGSLVLTSTLLTQKQWGEELADALRLLRTARVTDREADAWRAPDESVKARGGRGQRYDLEIPPGFTQESSNPLQLRDEETGGLFVIAVRPGLSEVRDELARLERDAELASPGQWITRRRGPVLVDGKAAAELVVLDELRDELRSTTALPLGDAVLVMTWRVHPKQEKKAAARLRKLMDNLRLL